MCVLYCSLCLYTFAMFPFVHTDKLSIYNMRFARPIVEKRIIAHECCSSSVSTNHYHEPFHIRHLESLGLSVLSHSIDTQHPIDFVLPKIKRVVIAPNQAVPQPDCQSVCFLHLLWLVHRDSFTHRNKPSITMLTLLSIANTTNSPLLLFYHLSYRAMLQYFNKSTVFITPWHVNVKTHTHTWICDSRLWRCRHDPYCA